MSNDDDNYEDVDLNSSDWGDSFDDGDSDSFEAFYDLGPAEETYDPEDDIDLLSHEIEQSERGCCPHDPGDDQGYLDYCSRIDEEKLELEWKRKQQIIRQNIIKVDKTTVRRQEILQWICNSNISRELKDGGGFFVTSGSQMRLKNGVTIDIIKWLITEGFCPNRYISGYLLSHIYKNNQYHEKMMFSKVGSSECSKSKAYQDLIENPCEYKNFNLETEDLIFVENRNIKTVVDESTDRQKEILEWIKNTSHAREFKSGNGFYIRRGSVIKLKNSEIIDIMDWLLREGFSTRARISNYDVKYSEQSNKLPETLHFFKLPEE